MEIEEEFISGFCRTMNGGETVCCEYTRQEDGSRKLTFMDCAHERSKKRKQRKSNNDKTAIIIKQQ